MSAIVDLATVKTEIEERLPEPASTNLQASSDQKNDFVQDALDVFSKALPRTIVFDQVGDGSTRRFVLETLLNGAGNEWVDRTSTLELVQLVTDPDGDDERVGDLEPDDWTVRRSAAGEDVLFLNSSVGTTLTMRLHYTRPHAVKDLDSAAASTIAEADGSAFLYLAMAAYSRWITAKASELKNQALGIDDVNLDELAARYKERTEELRELAKTRLSAAAGGAGTMVDWERDTALGPKRISH